MQLHSRLSRAWHHLKLAAPSLDRLAGLASWRGAGAGLGSASSGLERLAWFGAGLSAGSAAWLVGEVAFGPLSGLGHAAPPGVPPRPTPPPVRVQVAGAVVHPGAYDLPPGARVDDALHAAGGLAETADPSSLNLVARVADGQRIAVPTHAPDQAAAVPSARPRAPAPSSSPRERPRPTRTPQAAQTPTPPAASARPPPPAPAAG